MFPNDVEFMASEHRRDLKREADQMRLIKAAGLEQPGYWAVVKNVANWLGSQLVKWGSKLQEYGTTQLPQVASTEVTSMEYSQN